MRKIFFLLSLSLLLFYIIVKSLTCYYLFLQAMKCLTGELLFQHVCRFIQMMLMTLLYPCYTKKIFIIDLHLDTSMEEQLYLGTQIFIHCNLVQQDYCTRVAEPV